MIFAIGSSDWQTAAAESHMDDTGNPGLVPRNRANAALLLACATADPDTIPDVWQV
jgi:hypothetical protein